MKDDKFLSSEKFNSDSANPGKANPGTTGFSSSGSRLAVTREGDEVTDGFGPQGPSAVNLRLGRLRKAALKVVNTRSKVPQPFFWSLLHSELREIKKMKRRAHDERDAWLRGEPEKLQSQESEEKD